MEADQAQDLSAEQAADFAALQAAAAEGAPAPGAGEQQEQAVAQRPPLDQEIAGMLQLVAGIIAPVFPSVAAIYSEQTCGSIGAAVAPVCHKHGWMQGGIGGKYGEEIMALAVVAPIAWATNEAVKADLAARRKATKADKPQSLTLTEPEAGKVPTEQPGSKTVSFGAPVA